MTLFRYQVSNSLDKYFYRCYVELTKKKPRKGAGLLNRNDFSTVVRFDKNIMITISKSLSSKPVGTRADDEP